MTTLHDTFYGTHVVPGDVVSKHEERSSEIHKKVKDYFTALSGYRSDLIFQVKRALKFERY